MYGIRGDSAYTVFDCYKTLMDTLNNGCVVCYEIYVFFGYLVCLFFLSPFMLSAPSHFYYDCLKHLLFKKDCFCT